MKRLRLSGNALHGSKLSGTVEDYWPILTFNYSPSFDSLGRTLMLAKSIRDGASCSFAYAQRILKRVGIVSGGLQNCMAGIHLKNIFSGGAFDCMLELPPPENVTMSPHSSLQEQPPTMPLCCQSKGILRVLTGVESVLNVIIPYNSKAG